MYYINSVLIVTLLTIISFINAADDPIVALPKGKIRGHILKSGEGKPYYAFQEIPYAAAPVGSNRFQLPKEPQPWNDILNTTKNTVVCYQATPEHNRTSSEDCLYINVYTPVDPGTSKLLPVLVWIHGGGIYRRGATIEYVGPKYVMDHDVVVVSFNYRLGPFGFISTEDDVIPANLGLKDQYLALEWVQENIGLFGGNKSHVTIAGESAGGMAVYFHLLGPWINDKVLFHAAIVSSGFWLFNPTLKNIRQSAFQIGRNLDSTFTSENSKDLLQVLQKASSDELLKASVSFSWAPYIEKNGMFQYQVYDSLLKGNFKKMPVIMGYNSEERITEAVESDLKEKAAAYDKDPSNMVNSDYTMSAVNRTIVGNLLKRIYTNTSFEENLGAYIRYASDSMASTSALKQASLHSKLTDVYLYQFSYKGEIGGMMDLPIIPGCERVAHAEDLNYLWDCEMNSDLSKFSAEDGLMLHRFVKLWTNFVKYHNPTPEKDPLLQNVIWPTVKPNKLDNIEYLNMNVTLEVQANPRYYQKVIKVFDQYVTPEVVG